MLFAAMADSDRPDGAPVIPGHRLVRVLGEGGMGRVYLAEDEALGRRVAVKVLPARRAESEEARTRFSREARSLASIEHPNVVRVYGFGHADGQPYLVMEYVEGESLADRLRRERRLAPAEALGIARAVAEALAAAWEKGVVHRDVKPSNILLDRKGQVRVADFGLAKSAAASSDPTLTREGAVVGSPAYMSPEQGRGLAVDFRTDVYSLGVVVYEALAGAPPFEGATPVDVVAKHLYADLPSLSAKRPDLPAGVVRLVEWMTRKDPAARPGSYAELLLHLASLAAVEDGMTGSTLVRLPPEPRTGAHRARRIALVASGVVLLVFVAAAASRWLRPSPRPAGGAGRLAIAVAPFYGPDEDSAREGKVMASLVEGEVSRRLGSQGASIIGPDRVREVVRDHAAARALGERLGASVVIWGEALALHGETEIQPYFTLVPPEKQAAPEMHAASGLRGLDALEGLGERAAGPVVLAAQAANQIGLRRTGAAGVGDLVLLLAGVQALYGEDRPEKALGYFEQAPRSSESLRYRAEALERLGRFDDALAASRQAVAADPTDPSAQAQLGDAALRAGLFQEAVAAHRRAAETGKPYVARRAIFRAGRFYVRETFHGLRLKGREQDSGYLLALDPSSGRVLERYHCPGAVLALRSTGDGDAFEITYPVLATDPGGEVAKIGFSRGRFDHPVYGASLLQRRLGINSGWAIASNFVDWPHPVGFGPVEPPVEDAPRTLPALERALRAAQGNDPTQPWHAFFLGQAAWAQGRREEAAAVWGRMLAAPYAGIPYYEYAYMATFFEKSGQPEWADRTFAESLTRRRRMAQPVGFSTAIERMIDAPFVMRSVMPPLRDERAFVWLQRAQALTGVCGEGDGAAFDLWSRHWRGRGDSANEAAAEEGRRQSLTFSAADTLVHVDFAAYAFVVTTLAFWITLAALAARGPGRSIATLAPAPRRLLLWAWVACLASSLWLGEAGRRLARISEIDLGHTDATGSAYVIGRLDARVARYDVPQTRWVAAVANHLAGNRDRAAELYRSLPGDGRAEQNLEALERGRLAPPVPLTGADLLAAYTAERWSSRLVWLTVPGRAFRALYEKADFASPVAWVTALAGLLLAVAFARARPSAADPAPPSGRAARRARRLVPGLADLWSGRVFRGYAMLVLFLFPALVLAMQAASLAGAPGLGPLTSFYSFEVLKVYTLPSSFLRAGGTASAAARWWALLSHPHAAAFLVLAAAAAVALIVLYVRERHEHDGRPRGPEA
jgi:tetratricopeptide (TPR) repeat protein/predicted Ser/Thr protein kinase